MVRIFPSEEFREIFIDPYKRKRFAISNHGRVIRFIETFEDGEIIKTHSLQGYKMFSRKFQKEGQIVKYSKLVFRIVAETFLPRPSEEAVHVIHLDHNKQNDHVSNLKWVDKFEVKVHAKTSPKVIDALKREKEMPIERGYKLNATKVKFIKKLLFEPNRKTRLKIIAKRFGISEMQLHRIKTGENWGHVTID